MNKDEMHLLPVIVIDCVEKMKNQHVSLDTRNNFEQRVRVIRDYCDRELNSLSAPRNVSRRREFNNVEHNYVANA